MGIYREQVLPRVLNRVCGTKPMQAMRAKTVAGLSGTVVEIGFGSGLNIPVYPSEVTKVYAVEPASVSTKLAQQRIAASPVRIEHVGLDGQSIPLDDDSCDHALSTFTLCTIADVNQALAEIRRVVRPGGRFHFLEHGRSPDAKVEKWQHRLEPMQKRLFDGCHLTRDIAAIVEAAGFTIEKLETGYAPGPKPFSWHTDGVAIVP